MPEAAESARTVDEPADLTDPADLAASDLLDRRGPHRGDQRRTALLGAMGHLLLEQSLDDIAVADITARAGVTRSAFYFYFENKAACAAALGIGMVQEVHTANRALLAGDGTPAERIERTIRGVLDAWRRHRHTYRGMLEARRHSPAVRELWDEYREAFIAPLAARVDADRAAGVAPPGPDSRALITVLLELNDQAIERLELDDPLDAERRLEVLVTVWLRTLYGTAPDEPNRSST